MANLAPLPRDTRAHLLEREALLFPLPDAVWFPKTQMPLYVFEPRYRALVVDAERKRLPIAVVQLKPGWELETKLTPPIYDFCTFGHFILLERFLDGRFNVVLHGEHRCRILEETITDRGYRKAWVKVDDVRINVSKTKQPFMRNRILDAVKAHFSEDVLSLAHAMKYEAESSVEGVLYNLIHHIKFDAEYRQELLEMPTLTGLYHEVLRLLKTLKHPQLSTTDLQHFPYVYLEEN